MHTEAEHTATEIGEAPWRPRGIILTNLYATPAEPARGMFNQQQFAHLQRMHELLVIVPLPHRQPGAACSSRQWSGEREAPDVAYLNVWHPAVVGRLLNATLLAAAVRDSLGAALRAWRPDYVLGSFAYPDGVAAVRLARWLQIPAFVKVHGSDINMMARDPAIRWQLRRALPRACGVVAVSRALIEKVTDLGARRADTLLLYNGVDRQLFQPRRREPLRSELALPAGRRSVLYVGNLKRDKGVFDLLEAFRRLTTQCADVDLEFVGAGPAATDLQASIKALALTGRIRLHGPCTHAHIAAWLGACDLLCLPSHDEGVPNVVIEAQACGRPVVATRVGGIPEVMAASAGYLVEPKEPARLAEALKEALRVSWDPAAIARALMTPDWASSAARLSRFIGERCAQADHATLAFGER